MPEYYEILAYYSGMGQVHFILSVFQSSIAAYKKMLDATRHQGDKQKEAEALYNISYGLFWAHEFEEALYYAKQVHSLALEIDSKDMLSGSQFVMGYIYAVTANLDESFACLSLGVNLSQEIGNRLREGLIVHMMSLIHNWKGEYEQAEPISEHGIAIGRDYNILLIWLMNLWVKGITRCGKGDYEGSLFDLETGITLSDRLGDKVWKSRIQNTLGWFYSELYNLESAILANQEALEFSQQIGDPEIIRNAAVNLGDCYLLQGDLPTAASFLERVYHDSQQSGKWGEEWMKWRYLQHCCHSLGELRLMQGDAESALRLAQECLQLAEPTKNRKNIIKAWRLMGQVFLAQGNIERSQEFLEKAIALAEEIGNPPQLWKTYTAMGDLHSQCGQTEKAVTAYHQAFQLIEDTGSRLRSEQIKQTFLTAEPVRAIRHKLAEIELLVVN
jgi:tetratricopeptide (TPR) repeat protein